MFIYLKERIKKYKLNNIVPIDKGAFSHKTSITVEKETPNAGFSIVNQKNDLISDSVIIDLIDIDSFINDNQIEKLDFVKMDIEGAEIEALKGARESLKKYSPKVAIASYHKRDGIQTAKWVEAFLNEQGYKTWTNFPSHLTTYGYKI